MGGRKGLRGDDLVDPAGWPNPDCELVGLSSCSVDGVTTTFEDEEIEARRGQAKCPRPHSKSCSWKFKLQAVPEVTLPWQDAFPLEMK